MSSINSFLPTTKHELKKRNWNQVDVIIITGDAYVDHPSFGAAIIGRLLEKNNFKVAIISQPKWNNINDFTELGAPNLFFAITAGNTDSMVSNYTPNFRPRKKDSYSPGGNVGLRPDRAVIVYANKVKEAYPNTPIIISGIESSLRRFAHYDYWSNRVRKSILADAPADILIYGMGELQTIEIATKLSAGYNISSLSDIDGIVWKCSIKKWKEMNFLEQNKAIELPSYQDVSNDKKKFLKAFKIIHENQNPIMGKVLVQKHPKTIIIQNKPARVLKENELDSLYELPFLRASHPSYDKPVPALEPVKFSITTHRGCIGGCSFCSINAHQGRMIVSRSLKSILNEASSLTKMKDFKGIINGVGGPTSNMYSIKCPKWAKDGPCNNKLCLFPVPCKNLDYDTTKILEMLRELRKIEGVSKVFVGYGIRYDLAVLDENYIKELCEHHISGQLLVAPEHYSEKVTKIMRKPSNDVFESFVEKFNEINKNINKKQFLITYLMSGHPGCTIEDMVNTAEYIHEKNRYTEQVQEFTPTPMTLSTCIYHTGIDPFTGKEVHVPRSNKEKRIQRALLHYKNPRNHQYIYEGLKAAKRLDLVGNSWKCLISRVNKRKK